MSHGYVLLCLPCRELLPVGKIVNRDQDGVDLPWQLGGLYNDPQLPGRSGILIAVERFLIVHRGHRLHLAPEEFVVGALEESDPERTEWHDVAPLQELLNRAVDPEPDDEEDANRLPADLVQDLGTPWWPDHSDGGAQH